MSDRKGHLLAAYDGERHVWRLTAEGWRALGFEADDVRGVGVDVVGGPLLVEAIAALEVTERERDEARAELAELRGLARALLGRCRETRHELFVVRGYTTRELGSAVDALAAWLDGRKEGEL